MSWDDFMLMQRIHVRLLAIHLLYDFINHSDFTYDLIAF